MPSKKYDLAIITGNDAQAGTTAQVWLKLDGSRNTTGWFQFGGSGKSKEQSRHFLPGQFDYGSLEFDDLGDLKSCSVCLRGEESESWLPQSIELIEGNVSYIWMFNTWVRATDPVTRANPVREDSTLFSSEGPSAYDVALTEARRILRDAARQWVQSQDTTSPSIDEVLNQILLRFEGTALVRRQGDQS